MQSPVGSPVRPLRQVHQPRPANDSGVGCDWRAGIVLSWLMFPERRPQQTVAFGEVGRKKRGVLHNADRCTDSDQLRPGRSCRICIFLRSRSAITSTSAASANVGAAQHLHQRIISEFQLLFAIGSIRNVLRHAIDAEWRGALNQFLVALQLEFQRTFAADATGQNGSMTEWHLKFHKTFRGKWLWTESSLHHFCPPTP